MEDVIMFQFLELFRRARLAPEHDTSGPPETLSDTWSAAGWYRDASRVPAHPGRLGAVISPWGVVVHETQMHPDAFEALIQRTRRVPGAGNCYHFLIGRSPEQGVVQVAPIRRNANHAGGTPHGWIAEALPSGGLRKHHPNVVTVGIELHCAGPLSLVRGQWRTMDGGQPRGAPIPDADVDVRKSTAGLHAEHRPTGWQLDQLDSLLRALLQGGLAQRPAGALSAIPSGEPRGLLPRLSRLSVPVWSHRELSPDRKTDPSRATLEHLVAAGW